MKQFYVEINRDLVEEVLRKNWRTEKPITMVEGIPPSAELIGTLAVEDASRARGLRSIRLLFQCDDGEAPCADGSCFNPAVKVG